MRKTYQDLEGLSMQSYDIDLMGRDGDVYRSYKMYADNIDNLRRNIYRTYMTRKGFRSVRVKGSRAVGRLYISSKGNLIWRTNGLSYPVSRSTGSLESIGVPYLNRR